MAEQERCPECGRPFATTAREQAYPAWCNGGASYGCLRNQATKLKTELAAARAVIAAAEELQRVGDKLISDSCEPYWDASEAFDAAMAEWRRVDKGS